MQKAMLEQRKADEAAAGPNVTGFLRACGIRIEIDYDVGSHIDRAVKLINLTKRLNFTKNYLPEDPPLAASTLIKLIRHHSVHAGVIRVLDKYGDHGVCGIYVLRTSSRLLHFAFSSQLMGMGVETWLWHRLGRPELELKGKVATNIKGDQRPIDWIRLVQPDRSSDTPTDPTGGSPQRIISRGGCTLETTMHYFKNLGVDTVGEFNADRNGFQTRVDHSVFLRHAMDQLEDAACDAARGLGYLPQDFRTALFGPATGRPVWLLSFWADAEYALYRHRNLGFHVPFVMPGNPDHRLNAMLMSDEELAECKDDPERDAIFASLEFLKSHFDYAGAITKEFFKETLVRTLSLAPPDTRVFIIEPLDYFVNSANEREAILRKMRINKWTREVAKAFPQVQLLNIRQFIHGESEVHSQIHFDRMVYYRLFKAIAASL